MNQNKPEAKTMVVVSRNWKNPEIKMFVTQEGIGIAMELDKFLECLNEEMGNPTFLFTGNQQVNKMKEAAKKVVSGMKKETERLT